MKYWYRLVNISPLYNAYKENIEVCCNANSWASSVKYMLSLICGKGENVNFFNLNRSCNYFLNKFKFVLQDLFKKAWKEELYSDVRKAKHGNKLRCYRTFKCEFGKEDYLFKCNNPIIRKCLSKFRMSAHKLNIETGRYIQPRIEPEDRLCTNCNAMTCEDEPHFVLKCQKYNNYRLAFYNEIAIKYAYFKNMTDENKFIWLFSHRDKSIINSLGHFLSICLKERI